MQIRLPPGGSGRSRNASMATSRGSPGAAGQRRALRGNAKMMTDGNMISMMTMKNLKLQLIDVDYVLVAYQEPNVGGKDLRLKLQKKSSQQFVQGGKSLGVRDLREKLSGNMHSLPVNTDPPKPKATSEVARTAKKSAAPVEAAPAPEKRSTNSAASKKKSQSKTESSVDGLLRSLGLEKYLITFQAEEVDMTALTHMTDEDLKALGIPMGPRKKILLALDSRA